MVNKKVRPAVVEWKEPQVTKIAESINNNKTIAVVDLVNLPNRQLQEIRGKIKDNIQILITRKRLLKRALENSKTRNAEKLTENLKGMSALICTNINSFDLFKLLKSNMSDATAKPGQLAPFDIEVKAGVTPFSPGPILSELGEVGIKASIEGGKVIIKEDSVVVKEGEAISEKAAGILSRLDIKPIKIGLNLVASLEDGKILLRDILDIDIEEYIKKVELARSDALKLAISQAISTKETIEILISKAESEALALAREQGILTDKTASEVIAKAEREAAALKAEADTHTPKEQTLETENKVKGTVAEEKLLTEPVSESNSSNDSLEQSDKKIQGENKEE